MARLVSLFCFVCIAFTLINISDSRKVEDLKVLGLKKGDFSLKFTNWGATILSAILPDKEGKLADVVLGFESLSEYKNDTTYFGALVGRVANRIGGAKFNLDGKTYKLPHNDGNNTLHGGHKGFGDVIWKVGNYEPKVDSPYITFTYHSFDGEQGFPGDLLVSVTYKIIAENMLTVIMKAKALNKATPVNLAQHTYWNLGGHNSGDILSNTIQIYGSHITPVNDHLIPTGKIVPVKGTPYDFTKANKIGCHIDQLSDGYDINYVLNDPAAHILRKAATVHESKSGRMLELWTTAPGLQFYTGNMLKEVKGKDGVVYHKHAALCLETQGFPDSVNHHNFPSQIVRPGETYQHFMMYRFTTK